MAGFIQFNYLYMDDAGGEGYQESLDTTIHEIGHVLGFSKSLFPYFLDPKTGRPFDNGPIKYKIK